MLPLQRPPPSLWLIVVPYSSIEALRKHIADLSTSNPPQASHPLSEPRLRHQHKRRANPPASPRHPARLSMRPPVPWLLPLQLADFYQRTHTYIELPKHTRVCAFTHSQQLARREAYAPASRLLSLSLSLSWNLHRLILLRALPLSTPISFQLAELPAGSFSWIKLSRVYPSTTPLHSQYLGSA